MPTCELCRSEIPANVDRCPTCAAPISPQPATSAPMPDTPPSSGPDLSKIGFGALGNVEVNHDASQHIDQKTWHGMHPLLVIALVCVIFVGIILVILVVSPPGRMAGPIDPSPKPITLTDDETKPQVKEAVNPSGEAKTHKSPPKLPTTIPSPAPKFGVTPAPPKDFHITFDRADRVYYHKDKQALQITVPKRGYLYAASVWADGQMRILYHPDILTPNSPNPVEAGQTVPIPIINMSFTPADPSATTTEEEVRVVLSEAPLPGIPADRRADIRPAWEAALGVDVGSPHERMRVRGGELPLPAPSTQPATGILQHTVPYRMIRGSRPVSAP